MRDKNHIDNSIRFATNGFTLIEMLVVIFIFGVMATLFMVNFNALRGPRNLKIAQNELVAQIRKIQSYALSSRDSATGAKIHYYIIKFDTANPAQYTLQVIDTNLPPAVATIETYKLPAGITYSFSGVSSFQQPAGTTVTPTSCMQVGFALPYGKIYVDKTCQLQNQVGSASTLDTIANSLLTITLTEVSSGRTRTVQINGVNGAIIAQ